MTVKTASPKTIPPLQPGDRLSRDEFERRYFRLSHVKKAELIEGEVYMPSPVSFDYHGKQDGDMGWFLKHYSKFTRGTSFGNNTTIRLDMDNEPQPDHILFIHPTAGGRVQIVKDGFIEGSPELVSEISGTTASIDLGKKLEVYRRNGVNEYLVWRVFDEEIDLYALHQGVWKSVIPQSGILKSMTFPGLWLNVSAMLDDDSAALIATLNQGLASPEHAEFVARLSQALKS